MIIMENTENYKLVNTISMKLDAFQQLVEMLTDGLATVEYEFGAYISHTDKADENGQYWNESITDTLSRYFNAKVTGWHSDTAENPTIFICYE